MKAQLLAATLLLLALTSGAEAATITLSTADVGHFDSTGFHDSGDASYQAGRDFGLTYRGFLVFDLSGVTGTITGASIELTLPVGGLDSPSNAEDFRFTAVDYTPLSAFGSPQSGNVSAYDDLGDGAYYGGGGATGQTLLEANEGTTSSYALNASAIADLNGAIGGSFVTGIAGVSLSEPHDVQLMFLNSGSGVTRQLTLTTAPVPEPSSLFLSALTLGALSVVRRERSSS